MAVVAAASRPVTEGEAKAGAGKIPSWGLVLHVPG